MIKLRVLLPSLGLVALLVGGCFITQAQVFAHFALPNPFTIDSSNSPTERVLVDLNTVKEYVDHKDKLEGLSDLAVVGTFMNLSGQAGSVEVWITPDQTNLSSIAEIQSSATKLWGPRSIGAVSTVKIGWDESAQLFNAAGKKILIDEALGDGTFTLYTIGSTGVYNIQVNDGQLILTIDGGV
jgi:hypothetical protein